MENVLPDYIASIGAKDGVTLAAAVYLPKGKGRYPTLFAASPYRFDNNLAPAMPIFLWRETGPIEYYLKHGYAFVHLDVRGTGRSGGDYRYMDEAEQRDLYDVIVWIAKQDLVERQGRRYRPVLLCAHAVVHGHPKPTRSRLHRAL